MGDDQKKYIIEITTGSIARALIIVVGVLFLYMIRDIALIALVAIVIASAVEPLVRWFGRFRIPRVLAVILIYLIGISGFTLTFYALIPPLASDFQDFFVTLPTLLGSALEELDKSLQVLPVDSIVDRVRVAVSGADFSVEEAIGRFFSATSSVFSGLFSFVFVFVISFYLSVQEDGIANVLRVVTPRKHEQYVLGLWSRSQRKIGRWLQGQLLLGLIIGVIVFIVLTVLGVEYAFTLAILSAVFELIPYFGPILAAIPAVAVAAIQEPILGLVVLGVYVVVQQIENQLIYPQVVRKTVGVPPLLAIVSLLIGGKLAGMMGFIVAVPIAVVLVEFLNDVEAWKRASDST